MDIEKMLFSFQDLGYKDFISSLTPSVDKNSFIGIRVPVIRGMVKDLSEDDKRSFLDSLPHTYYEENLLHGFIIQRIKNYDKCIKELNKFLPYVDNWAVSDTMKPKVFSKHKDLLINEINNWINSGKTYTIRFAINMLMSFYLDDAFDISYLEIVKNIKSDEYYVNMMIAWFFATALAKKWDDTIKVIESKSLDKWVHNKSIQKAIESRRITDLQKEYLRTLKF